MRPEAGHLDQIPSEIMLGVAQGVSHASIIKRTLGALSIPCESGRYAPTLSEFVRSVVTAVPNIVGNLFIGSNMLLTNSTGESPLYLAAKFGHVRQVPPALLTESNLRTTNNTGASVTQVAFIGNGCYQLPEELLTKATVLQKDSEGDTALHLAAQHGTLDAIPSTLLTEDTILVANSDGVTPLHQAATFGHLNQVPKNLLSVENLLTIDKQGQTPLHRLKDAAKANQLDLLLGLNFPESVKEILGNRWWETNEAAKISIAKSKSELEIAPEPTTVEIF